VIWQVTEAVIPLTVNTPQRLEAVKDMLVVLGRECPGILVRVVPQYHIERHTIQDAYNAIASGLLGVQHKWVLYLEDDVELDPCFGEKAAKVAAALSERYTVLSLFSRGNRDLQRLREGELHYERRLPRFTYAQCLLMPNRVARAWGKELLTWADNEPNGYTGTPDIALGYCCQDHGWSIGSVVPSLAQHLVTPSSFGHGVCPQASTYGQRVRPLVASDGQEGYAATR